MEGKGGEEEEGERREEEEGEGSRKRRRGSGGGGGGGLLRQRVVSREGERLKLFYGHRLFPPSPSPSEDLCV